MNKERIAELQKELDFVPEERLAVLRCRINKAIDGL